MVFSNRTPGAQGSFTQLYELAPPVNAAGRYTLSTGEPFGPVEQVWTYADPDRFSATYISGAERLQTGNGHRRQQAESNRSRCCQGDPPIENPLFFAPPGHSPSPSSDGETTAPALRPIPIRHSAAIAARTARP